MPIENIDTEQLESARVQRAVKELFNQLEVASELAGQIKRLPPPEVTSVKYFGAPGDVTSKLIVIGRNFLEDDIVQLHQIFDATDNESSFVLDPVPPPNKVVNTTRIEIFFDEVEFPPLESGTWKIVVINPEGSESKCTPDTNCVFTVRTLLSASSRKLAVKSESQVTAIYPDHVDCLPKGETKLEVGIAGRNFTPKMKVTFEGNDIKVDNVAFRAPELLIVSIIVAEEGVTGAWDVTIVDPVSNQSSTLSKCFTVDRPSKGGQSGLGTA